MAKAKPKPKAKQARDRAAKREAAKQREVFEARYRLEREIAQASADAVARDRVNGFMVGMRQGPKGTHVLVPRFQAEAVFAALAKAGY